MRREKGQAETARPRVCKLATMSIIVKSKYRPSKRWRTDCVTRFHASSEASTGLWRREVVIRLPGVQGGRITHPDDWKTQVTMCLSVRVIRFPRQKNSSSSKQRCVLRPQNLTRGRHVWLWKDPLWQFPNYVASQGHIRSLWSLVSCIQANLTHTPVEPWMWLTPTLKDSRPGTIQALHSGPGLAGSVPESRLL